ncbi:UNVERIFIED_CONTAM: hypothetical protein FKN15_006615 [Acipenser sinensis]
MGRRGWKGAQEDKEVTEDYRKLRDWIRENAGLEAKSLPIAIRILWMMDSERWEAYQREHTPNNLEEAEGECLLSPCPPAEGECLLSPSPPAEGECLLGPRPPAEDECLLSPSPPAEGECLLGPRPPAEDECLLSPSPPAEGECLLGPRPPAEDECLLVSLPPPSPTPAREGDKPQSPAREAEPHQSPAREAEPHQSPAREAEQHQSPAKGGDYTLLPPPSPGDYTLLPPPLLPPQEPEGEEHGAHQPSRHSRGSQHRHSLPLSGQHQPHCLYLRHLHQQRVNTCWFRHRQEQRSRSCLCFPYLHHREYGGRRPTKGSYRLRRKGERSRDLLPLQQFRCRKSWGRSGDCSHCSFFAAGVVVAGVPQEGATGYKEGGGGLETTNPSSSFAAGVTVAGAPQRGAAGYKEGGGRGTTCPRSFFAAGLDQHAVSHATTGRGADSIASHGPTEASLPGPGLRARLLGF